MSCSIMLSERTAARLESFVTMTVQRDNFRSSFLSNNQRCRRSVARFVLFTHIATSIEIAKQFEIFLPINLRHHSRERFIN